MASHTRLPYALRGAIATAVGISKNRLQFASGLYSQCGWREAWSALVPGAGARLALLGNCGSLGGDAERQQTLEFLRRCSAAWEEVYWIPGPTELAASSRKHIYPYQVDALREAAGEFENITVLDQGEAFLPQFNVVLLGATGWTKPPTGPLPQGRPEHRILTTARDGSPKGVEASDIAELHAEDLGWLTERVRWWQSNWPRVGIIPLTHHLCSANLISHTLPRSDYTSVALDCMPAESTDQLLTDSPTMHAWLCGATGSMVSGEMIMEPWQRTFVAVNSCWSGESRTWRNPHYDPARCVSLVSERPMGGGTEWRRLAARLGASLHAPQPAMV